MGDPALTPAIVQDADDGRVLMLAWMDEEALRRLGVRHLVSPAAPLPRTSRGNRG